MAELGGAYNGGGHLLQQPGQGDLGHRDAAFVRQLGDPVDDDRVLLGGGVIFEPGIAVLLQALGGFARVFGEPSARQRAVWGHGDVVLPAQFCHLALLLAEDQVVVPLNRDKLGKALLPGKVVCLGQLIGQAVGDADVARLAGLDHAVQAVQNVVERGLIVPHVVDVQVDIVHPQIF